MWVLLIVSMGVVEVPNTAEFETKQACEKAAAWFNQRPKLNAVCVEDKRNDNAY